MPSEAEGFNVEQFRSLVERAAFVGEIGLDTESRIPLEADLAGISTPSLLGTPGSP